MGQGFSLLWRLSGIMSMIWTNLNLHYELFWLSGSFLNDPNPYLHFSDYLHWKRTWPFLSTILNSFYPSIDWLFMVTQGWFVPSLIEIGMPVLEKILEKMSVYFYSFVIISPTKRESLFIWTILNPLHLRMIWANFSYNWLCGSGEEVENVKSKIQTSNDIGQKNSLEISAQMS